MPTSPMPTPAEHLLPDNASALVRVLSAASARLSSIPVPIESLKRPFEVPSAFLPFLAWEVSTDVWFVNWPPTTKRAITSRSLVLHKHKGTAYAIKEYVRYAGSEVIRITTPPQRVFAGSSMSAAEREAWLSVLPQLRVYDLKERGQRGVLMFAGSAAAPMFLGRRFALASSARFRLSRRATMTLDGVTTPVKIDGLGAQADRVRIKGTNTRGLFCDTARRGVLVPTSAADRIVSFTLAHPPAHGIRFPVRPGLKVLSVKPEIVHQRGVRGCSVFAGAAFAGSGFLWPTTAPLRVYYRIPVFDAGKVPVGRRALLFAGRGRLGMPAHHAELQVSMPGRLPARAVSQFIHGHLVQADRTRWVNAARAVDAAQRLSDRIKINSRTYRPLRMGTALLLGGSYPLGRWTRS